VGTQPAELGIVPVPVFSLVIPCYNEAAGLPELVRRCRWVATEGRGEVVLVDNGSSDATEDVLEAELGPADGEGRDGVRWVQVPVNQGYGHGITSGLAVARAPIVGWTHADLQTDPADVLRALPLFGDTDGRPVLVKGRRYGRPVADRVFTAGMSAFETALLRRPLRDINAQPTLFSRQLLDDWGTPPADFSLDLFALYSAARHGFAVRRLPVVFAQRKFGTSSWNTDLAAKRRFVRRTVDYSLELRKTL
jgi:glycosyltransferase involved in cell wall biosynthesis